MCSNKIGDIKVYQIHSDLPDTNIPPLPNKEIAIEVAIGLQRKRQPRYIFITDDAGTVTDRAIIAERAQQVGLGWVFE
jgi:hypothetical protein